MEVAITVVPWRFRQRAELRRCPEWREGETGFETKAAETDCSILQQGLQSGTEIIINQLPI